MTKHRFFTFFLSLSFVLQLWAVKPTGLMTDLLEHPDMVFINGVLSDIPLSRADSTLESVQYAAIANPTPSLSWIVAGGGENNVIQTHYQIHLWAGGALLWDSEWKEGNISSGLPYAGPSLPATTFCQWSIRYKDNKGRESEWAEKVSFRTAEKMDASKVSHYPLQKELQHPVSSSAVGNSLFFDFGKDAFAQPVVTLFSNSDNDTAVIHIGERVLNGQVDRKPAGTTRYRKFNLPLRRGKHTYQLKVKTDHRHFTAAAVKMPAYVGEVTPFRYLEIEGYRHPLPQTEIARYAVFYPFNETVSRFDCSDTTINKVYDLCLYSMKATSFAGIFVDGDRERIPYEADALINQLSYYAADREYSISRNSHEYLLNYPTWPTEWILQSIMIAWYDYLYTGCDQSLNRCYETLKKRALLQLTQPNGLISTTAQPQTEAFLKEIGFKGKAIKDIVDWPHPGSFGMAKGKNGETDNFEFTDYNVVVNAYHYEVLQRMVQFATLLNKPEDKTLFSQAAVRVKKAIDKNFFDTKRGIYKDGITTDHASLHGNMFPLAFELTSEKNRASVTSFVRSRGMACSVYGSQFLLDAIYNGYDPEYGEMLLSSTDIRSWYNMIRVGSTISLEAWDDSFKPNQDWNHAWGSVPINTITRKMLGVEPMEAGFSKIRIRPQLSKLRYAKGTVPTIKGSVEVDVRQDDNTFSLSLSIPANTVSSVWMPLYGKNSVVTQNGTRVKGEKDPSGKFLIVHNVGSGEWKFESKKP